jgi:hypothetical protein
MMYEGTAEYAAGLMESPDRFRPVYRNKGRKI